MLNVILLMVGGAIGTLCRYGTVQWMANTFKTSMPLGTFTVNLLGCFVIGCLWGFWGKAPSVEAKALFFTGFLGGYTTFSSYALESFNLIGAGQVGIAVAYMLLSNILGLTLAALGFVAGKALA